MSVSFGGFSFINFPAGPPGTTWPVVSRDMQVTTRPGADGVEIQSLGLKGTPFRAFSFVDVDTYVAGLDTFRAYKALEGDGIAWPLDWHGQSWWALYGTQYLVLRVEQVQLQRVTACAGGISALSGAILRAQWDLCPVRV